MIGTLLIAVAILAVGTRAADGIRLRQQETILAKLPTPAAAAFYQLLQRRAWKVRILRVVAVLSLVAIIYARNRLWKIPAAPGAPAAATSGVGPRPSGTLSGPIPGPGRTVDLGRSHQ